MLQFVQSLLTTAATRKQQSFKRIMESAEQIAAINPNGLHELTRALLLPLQAEFLVAVAERERHKAPRLDEWRSFFFNLLQQGITQSKVKNNDLGPVSIDLASDTVFPVPWHRDRYANALGTIGRGKSLGAWKVFPMNHAISIWIPWKIAFVDGGNHSIAAGILAGEGHISVETIFDLRPVLAAFHCDGRHYFRTATGERVAKVTDPRRAAVFEIGRILLKTGVLPT